MRVLKTQTQNSTQKIEKNPKGQKKKDSSGKRLGFKKRSKIADLIIHKGYCST